MRMNQKKAIETLQAGEVVEEYKEGGNQRGPYFERHCETITENNA